MTEIILYQKPTVTDWLQVCWNLTDDERGQYGAFTGSYNPEVVAALGSQRPGPTWMLCADRVPIAIAGFDMVRPGVWQDFMFTTPVVWDKYWRSVTKHTRRVMDHMLTTGGAHRLQCVSLASRIHAHKWYDCLRLVPEGTLKAYGLNGEDAIMFARTRVDGDG